MHALQEKPRGALAVVVCVMSLLATSGCTPPELLAVPGDAGAEDIGSPDTGSPDTGSLDIGEVEAGVSDEVTFGEIADLVRGSCASMPSCHGETGFTNFKVEANGEATDEQVRAALEDVMTLDGFDLVAPSDAESSALYLRLVETGIRKMPPEGQPELSEQEIETVRVWIEQGASYE